MTPFPESKYVSPSPQKRQPFFFWNSITFPLFLSSARSACSPSFPSSCLSVLKNAKFFFPHPSPLDPRSLNGWVRLPPPFPPPRRAFLKSPGFLPSGGMQERAREESLVDLSQLVLLVEDSPPTSAYLVNSPFPRPALNPCGYGFSPPHQSSCLILHLFTNRVPPSPSISFFRFPASLFPFSAQNRFICPCLS